MTEEEPTTRVNMIWPESLKAQVREAVGVRGLTTFAVAAVEEKLSSIDAQKRLETEVQGLRKEVDETRYLAQLLADRFVMSDDRRTSLMEVDLPHWMETNGWPDELAELVPKQSLDARVDAVIEGAITPGPHPPTADWSEDQREVDDEDLHRPMFMSKPKRAGQSPAPVSERVKDELGPVDRMGLPPLVVTEPEKAVTLPVDLPHDTQGDDLLSKIRAKAAEKGVDIDEARLRPASQIPSPSKDKQGDTPADDPGPDNESPQVSEPQESTSGDNIVDNNVASHSGSAAQNVCPKCKDQLVNGECWTC